MRAPATLLKGGISAAAALLLLTACGGSDDEQSEASTSSSSSSSSSAGSSSSASTSAESGSADEDVQAFCTEAEAAFTQLSDTLDAAGASPADLPAALDAAVSAINEIEAPAEISADWAVSQQAFVGLRDAVSGADLTTPEGQASVQQAVTDLTTEAGEAQTNVDAYITENCENA